MATLYELNQLIENFEFEVDEETGEITNISDLDNLELEKDEKIENIGLWIKNLKADAKAYADEEKSFYAKKKAAENKVESLKNYLQYCLQGEKFSTDRLSISYRKSKSANIVNEKNIPVKYKIPQEPKISKADILKDLKEGLAVPGAELKEKTSLQIK